MNSLKGTFNQVNRCLKGDGVFLAAILGGDTLTELKYLILLKIFHYLEILLH